VAQQRAQRLTGPALVPDLAGFLSRNILSSARISSAGPPNLQPPAGLFLGDSPNAEPPRPCEEPIKKKATVEKLRAWRASLLRSRNHPLVIVYAPDEK
jgi:hypothetical protein